MKEQVSHLHISLIMDPYLEIVVEIIHSLRLHLHTLQTFPLQLQRGFNCIVNLALHQEEERACASTGIRTEALEPVREPVDSGGKVRPWVRFKLRAKVDTASSDYWEVELERGVES